MVTHRSTSNKYYLKRILSCFLLDGIIYIGISDTKRDFLQLKKTSKSISLLSSIIQNGILEDDIKKNKLATLLLNSKYLSPYKIDRDTNRNYLFIEYLNTIDENNRSIYLEKEILSKPIIIIGCGAIGSLVLYQLIQFGFTNITLFEGDKVSITDMQRIPIWRKSDVGKNKATAIKNIIKDNFDVSIKIKKEYASKENIYNHLTRHSAVLIIKTADPEIGFNLILDKISKKFNVPYVAMAYAYDIVKIGPFVIPGKTVDYQLIDLASKKIMGDKKTPFKSKKLFADYFVHPSVCFNINIGAGLGFIEVLFFLLERHEWVYTLGKEIQFSTLEKQLFINDYKHLLKFLKK